MGHLQTSYLLYNNDATRLRKRRVGYLLFNYFAIAKPRVRIKLYAMPPERGKALQFARTFLIIDSLRTSSAKILVLLRTNF